MLLMFFLLINRNTVVFIGMSEVYVFPTRAPVFVPSLHLQIYICVIMG